jgi:hypothetical protein
MTHNQGASANRRPTGQADGVDNLSASFAADRAFPAAVADAEVALIASSYPYGFEKSRVLKKTDTNGVVRFTAVHEWRVESTMIHGAEVFFWNWYVQKDGYVPYCTSYRSAQGFEYHPVVRLVPETPKP